VLRYIEKDNCMQALIKKTNKKEFSMSYLNKKQILEQYPFSRGQISHFLLHRHKNGLASAVRKIGKCVYIHKDLFDQWIESHASKGGQYE